MPRRGDVAPGPYLLGHLLLVPVLLGLAAWAVQHGPLDLAFAQRFADPATHTFSLRDSWLLNVVGHEAARGLPITPVTPPTWSSSTKTSSLIKPLTRLHTPTPRV